MGLLNFLTKKSVLKKRFTDFFKNNSFGSEESVSGKGSTLEQTTILRKKIPELIEAYGIKIFIDAPCGDFNWMQHTDLGKLDKYTGLDIVKDIVKENNRRFKTKKISFQLKDLCDDAIPEGDMILCRDCLVHLSFEDGKRLIKNLKKAHIKYLLVTTFPGRTTNTDLGGSIWRPLNMQLAPYSFPMPLEIINEGCTEDDMMFTDKSLGLYKLSDIQTS